MCEKKTVLIVDAHAVVRYGLTKIIDQQPDLAVVCEAADGDEAVRRADEFQPGIAVVDVALGAATGWG